MPHAAAPRRILVYTHNSIGLGHAVRTMAVIDGLRAALSGSEFLVLSGGSAPQIFLSEGVEVIKLPGLRHDLDAAGQPFRPRYLDSFTRDEVLAWRRKLIQESLTAFRPDVVMVEHSLAGLMGEAAPLLAGGRTLRPDGHVLIHLSRGIYREKPLLLAPPGIYDGLPPGVSVTGLYDLMYVLEDRKAVDVNGEFFGGEKALEGKIRYLGKVSAKNPEELRQESLLASAIRPCSPYLLASLGRHGHIRRLHEAIFSAAGRIDELRGGEVLVVLDPYLSKAETQGIMALPRAVSVRFMPFVPGLAEVMCAAELVVCRAGYNMVNELLMTGRRALVIPESHPSREQERRACVLPDCQIQVMEEAACLDGFLEGALRALLSLPQVADCPRFDRFRVGAQIARDIENLLAGP